LTAVHLALFDGMEGRFTEARQLMARGRAELAELGVNWWGRVAVLLDARLAMLADDAASAEHCLREALPSPDPWFESWARVELAWSVYVQGRVSEAYALIQALAAMPAPVDRAITIRRRALTARLLADRGRQAEAEHLIRGAVGLAEQTNLLEIRGDTIVDLAEILSLAGRPAEAAAALDEAVALYERKGNVVSASRARSALAAVR
jgi:tetratricopeptide (TPR) repeat protein